MSTSDKIYRPRLSVELDDYEDFRKLQILLPHGTQKAFFNVLVKEVINLLEVGGTDALAVVLAKVEPRLRLRECMPTLKEMEKSDDCKR
jgi:hypothetical protein